MCFAHRRVRRPAPARAALQSEATGDTPGGGRRTWGADGGAEAGEVGMGRCLAEPGEVRRETRGGDSGGWGAGYMVGGGRSGVNGRPSSETPSPTGQMPVQGTSKTGRLQPAQDRIRFVPPAFRIDPAQAARLGAAGRAQSHADGPSERTRPRYPDAPRMERPRPIKRKDLVGKKKSCTPPRIGLTRRRSVRRVFMVLKK